MSYSRALDLFRMTPKSPVNNHTLKTIALAVAGVLITQRLYKSYQHWDADSWFRTLLHLPYIGPKKEQELNDQINAAMEPIIAAKNAEILPEELFSELPEAGVNNAHIDQRLARLNTNNVGAFKRSGATYSSHTTQIRPDNPAWAEIETMQKEIISMCGRLMNGPDGSFGMMSHGNKSGIYETCRTYVNHARRENGIDIPEIIVPGNADPEFMNAALQLHAKLVKVPVDPKTGTADVAAMKKAITSRTCMMVASAPSLSYGLIDPIEKLAEVASKKNIPLHIDANLGGFFTPFAVKAGYELPPCDFSVKGVMSISMGTNPYAQTPADISILLFHPDCPATPPNVQTSLNSFDIITAWSTMLKKGVNGYVDDTRKTLLVKQDLIKELENIEGLELTYDAQTSVIGIRTTDPVNPALVAQRFHKFGWSVNLLRDKDQQVEGFNFCLTPVHAASKNFVSTFVGNVSNAIQYAQQHPDEKPLDSAAIDNQTLAGRRINYLYNRMYYALPGSNALNMLGIHARQNTQLPEDASLTADFQFAKLCHE